MNISDYNKASYQAKFAEFLTLKKYGNLSVKNYVSDLNHFLSWADKTTKTTNFFVKKRNAIEAIFTFRALQQYLADCKQKEEASTVSRRKSALSSFLKFAVENKWLSNKVSVEFQKLADKGTKVLKMKESLIDGFSQSLISQNQSKNTVRSYIADVREYLQITN